MQAEIRGVSNPFVIGQINGEGGFAHTSAADRIRMIRDFNGPMCVAAINNVPKLQRTVLLALRRRLQELRDQQ